jgi:predicted transcriptional regulator YdeE
LGYQIPSGISVNEPLITVTIKPDSFLRFTPKGDLRNGLIEKSWKDIWSSDLPRSYHADFEVYGEQAREIENAMVEIFISVK